jgi:outer membrane biosynthesis protein TonB
MSTMETPPPDTPIPPGPPERRCPRCGSTLAPDQEWCLACGAAAGTEVVEARGWRVPLYLGGALVALAILGVILAIVALSDNKDVASNTPQPTPSAAAPAPTSSTLPTVTPGPTLSPAPTTSPVPSPTTSPEASPTESPTTSPEPSPTESPTTTGSGSFPGWTGTDGDYTIIIESNSSQSGAEKVAQQAQGKGLTVGVLNSDDYSSLNGGYWVVFTGDYSSKSEAEDSLDSVRDNYKDAYVRQIKK